MLAAYQKDTELSRNLSYFFCTLPLYCSETRHFWTFSSEVASRLGHLVWSAGFSGWTPDKTRRQKAGARAEDGAFPTQGWVLPKRYRLGPAEVHRKGMASRVSGLFA